MLATVFFEILNFIYSKSDPMDVILLFLVIVRMLNQALQCLLRLCEPLDPSLVQCPDETKNKIVVFVRNCPQVC